MAWPYWPPPTSDQLDVSADADTTGWLYFSMNSMQTRLDDSELPEHPVAAMLTPRGRGAIATVRITGGLDRIDTSLPPLFEAANRRRLLEQPVGRIVFGRWGAAPAEDAVVCRTALNSLEVHCHGGHAAVQRILDSLESLGIRSVSWQSQNSEGDGILSTEFLEAMGKAGTLRAAGILLDQYRRTFRDAIERLLEASQSEGDELFVDLCRRVDEILSWSSFGLHLSRPWKVVLTGRPNVGKSSLVNALLGYSRSIVYAEPGTTRDVVTAETAFDGWVMELSDTAGIRETSQAIEAAGIEKAREHVSRADCRVIVLDVSRPPDDEDFELLRNYGDALVVAHKSDLPDVWEARAPSGAIRVSSRTGDGVDALGSALVTRLVPRVPGPGTPVPATERQVRWLEQAREAARLGDRGQLLQSLVALLTGR